MNCDGATKWADESRGTNPCENSVHSLSRVLEIIDCCRRTGRNERAIELLDHVASYSLGVMSPISDQVCQQRKLLASGEATGVVAEYTIDMPPMIIRGINFAGAMFRWAASGLPRRSQAEIDERLAICQACPQLVDNHCNLCGCACIETNQLMNKLALSTEQCPLGKWK